MSTPTNAPISFDLDRSIIKAVGEAMSSEEARYYLNGIHFAARNNRLIVEATDGHILIRATLAAEGLPVNMDFIMPKALVEQICKAKYPKAWDYQAVTITADGNQLTAKVVDTSYGSPMVDGSFPDADRVIPTRMPKGEQAHFNPYLLMRLNRAGEYLNGTASRKQERCITVHTDQCDTPAVVTFGGHPEALGVCMPIRDAQGFDALMDAYRQAGITLDADPNNDRNLREAA